MKISKIFTTKVARRSWFSAAVIAIFIAIAIVLNMVANLLVERFPALSADLTSNQVFEMQSETKEYLEALKNDITITVLKEEDVLSQSGSPYYVQANKLFKQFAQNSDHITLKYVDIAKTPTYINNYSDYDSTQSSNMLIIEKGKAGTVKQAKDYKALSAEDLFDISYDQSSMSSYIAGSKVEQAIVTAILNINNENKTKIALLTGMGENEQYYSGLVKFLENNAYEVNTLNLLTQEIDDDYKAVILYTPTVDLTKDSVTKIENFLSNSGKKGKNLVFIPSSTQVKTPNIDKLLKTWNMKISDGLAYETDTSKVLQYGYLYFVAEYGTEFTDKLKNATVPVVTAYSRAITFEDGAASIMLKSSEKGGIMPFSAGEDFKLEEGLTGDAVIVAAVSTQASENADESQSADSNVVVFGSDFMVSADVLSTASFNNANYVINVFNTITGREDMGITITGKSVENTELGITSVSDPGIVIISTLLRFIIPIGILVAGLVIWLRRRNR